MKKTHHSEFGRLESVFIKPVAHGFVSDELLSKQWKDLNYLGKPEYQKSLNEYQIFEDKLLNASNHVYRFPYDKTLTIDSVYCRDASILTNFGAIICNMGKGGRINEPRSQKLYFEELGIPILGTIETPGTLEGGDVAWLDEYTLAVGHTYRTNYSGIEQLKALLEPKGVQILIAELPHYKGKNDVFHLMSVLSPLDKDLAVVYSPLMPIHFRDELLDRGIELIEVPDSEFESMGCNVLAVAPRDCVIVAGNPTTENLLREAGCIVFSYSGNEISVKGGGGPTCLTRPLERWVY